MRESTRLRLVGQSEPAKAPDGSIAVAGQVTIAPGTPVAILVTNVVHEAPDVLIAEGDAEERYGLPHAGLRREMDEGRLPYVEIGRGRFVRLSDLLKLPKAKAAERAPASAPRPAKAGEPADAFERAVARRSGA